MISELTVTGYRGLKSLTVSGLGRVNLFVGMNSSGKTSILEAIHALSCGEVSSVFAALARRSELSDNPHPNGATSLDIRGIFHGFSSPVGARATIATPTARLEIAVRDDDYLFSSHAPKHRFPAFLTTDLFKLPDPSGLLLPEVMARCGIGPHGDCVPEDFPLRWDEVGDPFISSGALAKNQVISMYTPIVLTQHEDRVIEAMRIVEPDLDRIALVGPGAGIAVKLRSVGERVPIGSLGEGAWRLLGLTLAMVRTNGVVLVDDIDTGLHHSVMPKMWELVKSTAQRLGIQVFATTHSRDCVEALASISHEGVGEGSAVTIHRVERGRPTTVAYTEQEIVAAAARGIEVR